MNHTTKEHGVLQQVNNTTSVLGVDESVATIYSLIATMSSNLLPKPKRSMENSENVVQSTAPEISLGLFHNACGGRVHIIGLLEYIYIYIYIYISIYLYIYIYIYIYIIQNNIVG